MWRGEGRGCQSVWLCLGLAVAWLLLGLGYGYKLTWLSLTIAADSCWKSVLRFGRLDDDSTG